jgi:hypothetical protein
MIPRQLLSRIPGIIGCGRKEQGAVSRTYLERLQQYATTSEDAGNLGGTTIIGSHTRISYSRATSHIGTISLFDIRAIISRNHSAFASLIT